MKYFKFIICCAAVFAAVGTCGAFSNECYMVELNSTNGGLKSFRLNADADQMNWIEGLETWGTLPGFEFKGTTQKGAAVISTYRKGALEVSVERTFEKTFLRERFAFHNTAAYDLYFQRGEIGIFTTFNDNYTDAAVCETKRCHAHIWCGGALSYVHALKMGLFPTELALILTEGEIDSYSVRRVQRDWSNDRGDFILHPMPMHFLPGETKVVEWELAAFAEGTFKDELLKRPHGAWIQFEEETIFPNEAFCLTVESAAVPKDVRVRCNGEKIPFTIEGKQIRVTYKPHELGEHVFEFVVDGRRFVARGFAAEDLDTIIDRRIRFIIRNQQMLDKRSPLYGAYLIYDTEEKAQYFDYARPDHNACRERFGMGLLICRRLQKKADAEMERSLDLFEQFLLREVFDTETGEVCNNIGKNAKFKRLYNAPWLITFWLEMYRLRGEERYLTWIGRTIRNYYTKGGARFYPNGSIFSDAIKTIRDAGQGETADELAALFKKHVDTIRANGILYPPHEVRFEQTIVTPALSILSASYALLEKNPAVLNAAREHARILLRFNGEQPDHKLNSLPIRHWDGYWFGKRAQYGDTLHYWSCLSAYALALHARNTNDAALFAKARTILRNLLCLFFTDGTASCAYLHPYSITMTDPEGKPLAPARRGEYFDPWANDQDFALYYILRIQDELNLPLTTKGELK